MFIYLFGGSAVAVAVVVVPVYNSQAVAVVMLLSKFSNVNIWNDILFLLADRRSVFVCVIFQACGYKKTKGELANKIE